MTTTQTPTAEQLEAVDLTRLHTVTDYCMREGMPPARRPLGAAVHLGLFAHGLEVSLHGDASTVPWAEALALELGAGPLRPADPEHRYTHVTGNGSEHLEGGVVVRVYDGLSTGGDNAGDGR